MKFSNSSWSGPWFSKIRNGRLLRADFFQQFSSTVCCFRKLIVTHFILWRAGTKYEVAAVKAVTRYLRSLAKQTIPFSNVKPITCPVVGVKCFNDSACQPLVRRHTPIFQNHGHIYGGSCVHEQTRTRHDRNAKKAVPRCTNSLLAGTGSGTDFFCYFVPRHLEQKRKKRVFYWKYNFALTHYQLQIKMNVQKLRR